MDLTEKTISSEKIYNGKIINLKRDTVLLPDGETAYRELIEHPGGVSVLPIDSEGYTYLVKQYRKPYEEILLEAPAGKLSPGEEPIECGKRELIEETGLVAKKMIYLGWIIPTPGYTNEKIHLYLALDLTQKQATPDEDEFLKVEKFKFNDIVQKCISGEIKDAKTVISVLRAKEVINSHTS